ncbi:hypothetical protein ACP70R_024006 [Stipagrostis hirtigluma subsp. patula]
MRSPVFEAKFFGNTMDSSQLVVRIDDMSAAVFAAMLHFVYTDDDDVCTEMEDDDMVYDLLVAADLYDLRRLRLMCEKRLSEGIDGVPAAMSMLALVHRRHKCRQLEELCIGDPDDGRSPLVVDGFYHKFSYDNNNLRQGNPRLVSVVDAKSWYVGPNDSLTVRCDVEVTTSFAAGAAEEEEEVKDIAVPPSSISWHLERLLETQLGSDVTFLVEDTEFHAHSLLLSLRSPALLLQQEAVAAAAQQNAVIRIDGVKAVVFRAVLHFVYTDELPPLDELVVDAIGGPSASRARIAGDLLAAADRFQLLERMMPMCEDLLCDVITPGTAADTLALAERHRRPELRAFCVDYIASSPDVLKTVVRTQVYKDLKVSSDGGQALGDIIERMLAVNFS